MTTIPDRINEIKVSSRAYPGLDRKPGVSNWVDAAGGLPSYIERIAKHLHYEKKMSISRAIATAVNVVKRMCAGGDLNFPGKQNISAKTKAQACKAVAEWTKKKSKGRTKKSINEPVLSDEEFIAQMLEGIDDI